jgi:hypothetical protein
MRHVAKELIKYLRSPFLYFEAFQIAGLWGIFYEARSRRSLWFLREKMQSDSRNSSLSDKPSYVEICKAAVENELVFEKFKANIEYREILEHVSWKHGYQYLKLISRPEILRNLVLQDSLDVGGGLKYKFDNLGYLSPTQIRYAKISQDLIETRKSLDGFTIIEIGVGNCGQALHLMSLGTIKSYILVDIPEVLDLGRKILSSNPNFAKFKFVSAFDNVTLDSDLIISNYAYSELDLDVQEDYYRRFLSRANSGYLLYNYIKNDERNLSADDLMLRIPSATIKPEEPMTFPGNVLLSW